MKCIKNFALYTLIMLFFTTNKIRMQEYLTLSTYLNSKLRIEISLKVKPLTDQQVPHVEQECQRDAGRRPAEQHQRQVSEGRREQRVQRVPAAVPEGEREARREEERVLEGLAPAAEAFLVDQGERVT